MDFNINEIAAKHQDYIVSIRRKIHEHPEKGMQEYETAKLIRSELDAMGIPWKEATETGTVGIIKGNGSSDKVVALRADIDALELEEKTDVPFASKVPGMMHGCGHDSHAAMLLGAAKVLKEMGEENIPGTIYLLFQPGEETTIGAKLVVETNVLEGIDAIYGQHIWPLMPSGTICSRSGGMMAGAKFFDIKVTGKGGHGSDISKCADPLLPLAQIAVALNTLVGQRVAPREPATVCVGKIQCGSRGNIVPEEGEISGTIRFLSDETESLLMENIEKTAKGIAEAYGVSAEVKFSISVPALINDESLYEIFKAAAANAVGESKVVEMQPVMGSEDFSHFRKYCPAFFSFIGSKNEEKGCVHVVHSGFFKLDEDILSLGAAMHVQFAMEFFRANS